MTATSPTGTALVVVDMQNDFLGEGGAFSKCHRDPTKLTTAVAWLVAAARQQGRVVVWVTSEYDEVPAQADDDGHTHRGRPCCVRGSWGAGLVEALASVPRASDREFTVVKRWYSAFRDTELHARLSAAGVTTIVLCGVGTDVGVTATAREARELGYAVEVIADATAAGTLSRHQTALKAIERLGGRRREWGEFVAEGEAPVTITGIGAGETALWCGALRDTIADGDATFEALAREVDWQTMFHRGGEVPRRVAIQGLREADGAEPLYRHPADEQPEMRGFTPIVDAIRRAVEARVGHRLNHCLLQLYRDGRDWIGEHADKTLDLVRPSTIVNVSLGRTRTMLLRPKRAAEGDARAIQRVPLPHGSFLVMDLETNRGFFHAIRQEPAEHADAPRISLTFRDIGTYRDPRSGAVWGVGAPTNDRAQAEAHARAHAELPAEERRARELAEASRMLTLFREENQDPAFDAAAYRPGFSIVDLKVMNAGT